jgi:hypothetical protein
MKHLQLSITSLLLVIVIVLAIRLWPLADESSKSNCPPTGLPPVVSVAPQIPESIRENIDTIQKSVANAPPVPESIKASLIAIEEKITKEDNWPNLAEDVKTLHDQLASALNQLPPRTQEELLPSLVPLRWSIQALWLLFSPPPVGSDSIRLSSYADEIESLASNRPNASSENLETRLMKRLKEIREQVGIRDRAVAIKEAQDASAGNGDIAQAIRRVSGYEDKEAKGLLLQLVFMRDLQALSDDLQIQGKLGDLSLREFALARLNQGVLDLRLRASIATAEVPKPLLEKLAALEKLFNAQQDAIFKSRQEEFANKRRDYQIWALNEIKEVPLFADLKASEKAKIGPVDKNNPFSKAYKSAEQIAKTTLRESLILHMAPIETSLLDEAVATWYRKVFQQRFNELDEADQFTVITAFSTKLKATSAPTTKQ